MQFLAISKPKEGATKEGVTPHMLEEVKETLNLYLLEKIRHFYMRKDQKGVIFHLDADSEEKAKEILSQLPLVKKGFLDYEFIAIGPLMPIGLLTGFTCEV